MSRKIIQMLIVVSIMLYVVFMVFRSQEEDVNGLPGGDIQKAMATQQYTK